MIRRTEYTGRRFRFIDVPYTEAERERLKQDRIRDAMEWVPPTTHTETEEIPKGHPDYDVAFMEEVIQWLNI